jgi:hypothetical protein
MKIQSSRRTIMRRTTPFIVTFTPFLILASASQAWSQSLPETGMWVQWHLNWTEVDALTGLPVARPNGVLNPGEAAQISVSISFTPTGTLIPQPPALGPGWRVHALGQTVARLSSPGGTWSHVATAPGWTSYGHIVPGAAVIMLMQNPAVDIRNPVPDFWHGIWTPAQYSNTMVPFATSLFGSYEDSLIFAEVVGPPLSHPPVLVDTNHAQLSIPMSSSPAPCYANCDGSTAEPILTIDDFICFVNEFALAHALPPSQQITHYANCDGSTTQPVLTVNDFVCFINEFAQGCP